MKQLWKRRPVKQKMEVMFKTTEKQPQYRNYLACREKSNTENTAPQSAKVFFDKDVRTVHISQHKWNHEISSDYQPPVVDVQQPEIPQL